MSSWRRKLGSVAAGPAPIETVRRDRYRRRGLTRLSVHLSSLRVKLEIAIVSVAALTLALAFVAVYRATRANTQRRIDRELLGQVREWHESSSGHNLATPRAVERVARRFVTSQGYHPARGDEVEFAVSDTGPGIQEDQLERIFERFHRTDSSRVRDRGGSGLGLPIARVLVEAHGGKIWVESAPGTGACVRFTIPGYRRIRGTAPEQLESAR